MRVRLGCLADIPWAKEQLRAFAASYPVPLPIFGEDAHVEATLGVLIREQYLAVACREDGASVGLIAGFLTAHPFNPALRIVSEAFWWVTPEHRGSRAGLMLLADLERWAEAHDAPLCLTTEVGSALNDRHLAKRGYIPVERQFLRLPGSAQ